MSSLFINEKRVDLIRSLKIKKETRDTFIKIRNKNKNKSICITIYKIGDEIKSRIEKTIEDNDILEIYTGNSTSGYKSTAEALKTITSSKKDIDITAFFMADTTAGDRIKKILLSEEDNTNT